MTTKLITLLNLLLSTVIGLLGFGCATHSSPIVAEYGVPHAEFTVKGKVSNKANEPLENIQIILKRGSKDDTGIIYLENFDALYTNTEGDYYKYYPDVFPLTYSRVIVNDTTEVYASDSLDVNTRYSGGDGNWNLGESTLSADFVLEKKSKTEE